MKSLLILAGLGLTGLAMVGCCDHDRDTSKANYFDSYASYPPTNIKENALVSYAAYPPPGAGYYGNPRK